jgi:hypothetical protein
MPSGGSRSPAPNTLHPNRSDMTQAPQANRGQPYGTRSKQLEAQNVIPIAGRATPTVPPANSDSGAPGMAPDAPVPPGTIPSLTDPTAYPEQPVTSGLPNSPGAGPEALSVPGQAFAPPELSELRALYSKYRNQSLLDLIEFMESKL